MKSNTILDKFNSTYQITFKLLPNKLHAIIKMRGFKSEVGVFEVESPERVSFYANGEESYKDGYSRIIVIDIHSHFRNRGLYKSIIKRTIQELKKYRPEIKGLKSFEYDNVFESFDRSHDANIFWMNFHYNNVPGVSEMNVIKDGENYFVELLT